MNQTRTFLIFALLAVAYMLFMAWEKDYAPQPPAAVASSSSVATPAIADSSVPGAMASTSATTPVAVPGSANEASAQLISVTNDVLRLTIDTRGGSVVRSELLTFPDEPRTRRNPDPAPVRLLND